MTVSVESTGGANKEWTVGTAFTWACATLENQGIETATLDSRVLLDSVAGNGGGTILAWREQILTATQRLQFQAVIERRTRREPVARILGEKEFWSLPFQISPDTLIPRPDSEILVETAVRILHGRKLGGNVLDLGTGSGCLLLAVLSECPQAKGLGIDISPGAVAMATSNAQRLGLAGQANFQVGDWDRGLDAGFDAIVCNPPYIPTRKIATLDADVAAFDPVCALDGGVDGLAAIRIVGAAAVRLLSPGGTLIMEIGADQEASAAACLATAGLRTSPALRDLAGHPRCLVGQVD